jgi:hypothetical protein
MKRSWQDVAILVALLVASIAPMWALAESYADGDEFRKSALGIIATTVVAVYRLWSNGTPHVPPTE